MALVSNTWSQVSFLPFGNAAWNGYTPPFPDLPSVVANAINAGSDLTIFPIGAVGATAFIIADGMAGPIYIETAVIAATANQTTLATPMDNGDTWYSMRDPGSGAWIRYQQNANFVYTLTNSGDIAALAAFLT